METCQSLLKKCIATPSNRDETRDRPIDITAFFDRIQSDHDADPTFVLDRLESEGLKFAPEDFKAIKEAVIYRRDRTPSFLSYTWAYDRDGEILPVTDYTDIGFWLFIILESLKRKDATLLKVVENSGISENEFESGLYHMFAIRGWDYFVPWFVERYDVDPRSLFIDSSSAYSIFKTYAVSSNFDETASLLNGLKPYCPENFDRKLYEMGKRSRRARIPFVAPAIDGSIE